ncbi:metal-dependent hydrolase [Novosphingobium piscinae]|uniref:Metal-dependent hydrolase n=1 Tax=Novosphingobium piscinae TaxID=1507448 RepID=A0A7X1KR41_9SPHN|nr:metal-dependent hydrolase [Novosphingobium piscinae]MBC2670406.1 metal-dependent hydrolase [Novosphingobium piscinae]
MNAPSFLAPSADGVAGDTRPAKHGEATLTVRDLRFGRTTRPGRWWLGGDPVATAWHTALSATFPRGEAFFIESVKACRDGAPPRLEAEIRDFVRQEINHTREHLAFNRGALEAGYDFTRIDAHVEAMLALTKGRPPEVNLAATMALEHFTAMLAHEFLANPAHFAGGEPEVVNLWRWHAIEEIEHKAVAFDTYRHATRNWRPRRRWVLRCLMMLIVTRNFLAHRIADALDLLAQDGITGWRAKGRLLAYLFIRPGVLRRIFPSWISYFRPSFHPWDHDDRALIATAERALAAG